MFSNLLAINQWHLKCTVFHNFNDWIFITNTNTHTHTSKSSYRPNWTGAMYKTSKLEVKLHKNDKSGKRKMQNSFISFIYSICFSLKSRISALHSVHLHIRNVLSLAITSLQELQFSLVNGINETNFSVCFLFTHSFDVPLCLRVFARNVSVREWQSFYKRHAK